MLIRGVAEAEVSASTEFCSLSAAGIEAGMRIMSGIMNRRCPV
jgi:hypothetical protein